MKISHEARDGHLIIDIEPGSMAEMAHVMGLAVNKTGQEKIMKLFAPELRDDVSLKQGVDRSDARGAVGR